MLALLDTGLIETETAEFSLSQHLSANLVAVYETLKQRAFKRYFTSMHISRLFHSADILGIQHKLSVEDIVRGLNQVREANPVPDMNIRIQLNRITPDSSQLIIAPAPIPPLSGSDNNEYPPPVGVDLLVFEGERQFPQAKSMSLLLSTLALEQAKANDCWDALLMSPDGMLLEGSRSSFYWINNAAVYNAPLHRILSGVTRENLIRSARPSGIEFREGLLKLEELISEPRPLMVSSTSITLQPVKQLILPDGHRVKLPQDSLVNRLSADFHNFLKDGAEKD